MKGNRYIRPALFKFLEDLKQNNSREWFQANKSRYEKDLLNPLLEFIEDFAIPLRMISPFFVADSRRVGGSLFRIHRDVRFSNDKSPYKTAAGIHFRHAAGKDVHCPGYYLHLEPQNVFAGVGIWHPDSQTLLKIRNGIVDNPGHWTAAVKDESFRRWFTLEGDSLVKAPKGFDPEHPLVGDLKRKDFVAFHQLQPEEAFAEDFLQRFASICQAGSPLMRFLTAALMQPF